MISRLMSMLSFLFGGAMSTMYTTLCGIVHFMLGDLGYSVLSIAIQAYAVFKVCALFRLQHYSHWALCVVFLITTANHMKSTSEMKQLDLRNTFNMCCEKYGSDVPDEENPCMQLDRCAFRLFGVSPAGYVHKDDSKYTLLIAKQAAGEMMQSMWMPGFMNIFYTPKFWLAHYFAEMRHVEHGLYCDLMETWMGAMDMPLPRDCQGNLSGLPSMFEAVCMVLCVMFLYQYAPEDDRVLEFLEPFARRAYGHAKIYAALCIAWLQPFLADLWQRASEVQVQELVQLALDLFRSLSQRVDAMRQNRDVPDDPDVNNEDGGGNSDANNVPPVKAAKNKAAKNKAAKNVERRSARLQRT